jgi:hypothetical protein
MGDRDRLERLIGIAGMLSQEATYSFERGVPKLPSTRRTIECRRFLRVDLVRRIVRELPSKPEALEATSEAAKKRPLTSGDRFGEKQTNVVPLAGKLQPDTTPLFSSTALTNAD